MRTSGPNGIWAKDERITAAAFYKKIDNPIETYTTITDTYNVTTSFANAPEATLYGAEVEVQKYVPLDTLSDSSFFVSRRIALIGNYTYTQSKLKVGAGDTTIPYTYTTGGAAGGVRLLPERRAADGASRTIWSTCNWGWRTPIRCPSRRSC